MTASAATRTTALRRPAISSRPNGRLSALEASTPSATGIDDARREEDDDDDQHHQREALLLHPAAALDVVDPAEGGVHRAPERGADPDRADRGDDADRGRAVADPVDDAGQRALLGGGEDALQVAEHARLDVGVLDHLAEDEQDQERERKQRQREVVGDHRREAGDVLAVGALPEDAQEPGRSRARPPDRPRPRVNPSPGSPAGPRSRGWRAGPRSSPPRRPPRPRPRRCPRARRPARAARLRRGSRLGARRRPGARRGGRAAPARGFGGGLRLRGSRCGFAAPSRAAESRRGLRVPGRASGRLPNTPPPGRLGSASGSARSSLIRAVFQRDRRTRALRLTKLSWVSRVQWLAAVACTRIRAETGKTPRK